MTKVEKIQYAETKCKITEIEHRITLMLLQALGFDIKNGFVLDQDTFEKKMYRNKFLKYQISDQDQLVLHTNDILFNPLNNAKLVMDLFTQFLYKENLENNLYVQSHYPDVKNDTTSLVIHKYNGTEIEIIRSEYYINPSYPYVEMILGLFGFDCVNELKALEELRKYAL